MTSTGQLSRGGRIYVGCVILAGGAAIVHACADLYRHPLDWQWFILAGLTLLSGSITVKVPSIPAAISVSETFVFTAVMLFGPSAGTITVALDGLIISLWLQRKKREAYKAFFNVAAPSLSLWASAQLYFALGAVPLAAAPKMPVSDILVPLIAFTLAYFLLNSSLIAVAISAEKATPAVRVWRENFFWLSLNFFSGASVATLLVAYTRQLNSTAVGLIIPILIISYLTYKTSMGRLEDTTRHLSELNLLYLSTIETLAMWIDAKDQITHGHIRRVQNYAVALSKELGVRDEKLIKAIEAAALLHDMGKLAIPEHILNKPGKLTPGEFEQMKSHASIGAQILSSIDFPYPVVPIVRHHHENWDGTGYPDRLAGTDIPIGARILAVVDCFDALTSDRPYRPRLGDEEALRMLALRRGSMYDPLVVDAFLRIHTGDGGLLSLPLPPSTDANGQKVVHPPTNGDGLEAPARRNGGISMDVTGETGRKLLQVARQAVPVSLAVLFSHDAQDDALVVAHAIGDGSSQVDGLTLRLGHGVSGWVAANRRAMANCDAFLDLGQRVMSDGAPLRSCLSVPVLQADALLAVITLYSTESNRFSRSQKELLESHVREFANELGTRSETLDGEPSDVDRGPLDKSLAAFFVHGELCGQRVGVVLLDMRAKIEVSEVESRLLIGCIDRTVRDSLRGSDLTVRISENELLIILPQTDSPTARATAVRISDGLLNESFELPDGDTTKLNVTYGVAVSPEDGSSFDSLIASARRTTRGPRSSFESESESPTVH